MDIAKNRMQRHKKSASESVLKLKNAKKKNHTIKNNPHSCHLYMSAECAASRSSCPAPEKVAAAVVAVVVGVAAAAVVVVKKRRRRRRTRTMSRNTPHHIQKDGNMFTLGYPQKHVTSCNNV